jgi:AraC-like DNA-binding protein
MQLNQDPRPPALRLVALPLESDPLNTDEDALALHWLTRGTIPAQKAWHDASLEPGRFLVSRARHSPKPTDHVDGVRLLVELAPGEPLRPILESLAGWILPMPEEIRFQSLRADDPSTWEMVGRRLLEFVGHLEGRLQTLPGRTHERKLQIFLRLEKAREFLVEKLNETRSAELAAALANMSRAHFIRSFRSFFGITPKQLRQERRYRWAAELLESTELSATEISRHCGFADRTAFHRMFKESTGFTPSEWRRSRRPGQGGDWKATWSVDGWAVDGKGS